MHKIAKPCKVRYSHFLNPDCVKSCFFTIRFFRFLKLLSFLPLFSQDLSLLLYFFEWIHVLGPDSQICSTSWRIWYFTPQSFPQLVFSYDFMYLLLDTSWSLPALDCSSNSWSCRTSMLLLMHFLPLRSYFLKFKIVLAMHSSLWMLLLTYLGILQDLLTKHESAVSQYLTDNYSEVCYILIITIIYPLISLRFSYFLNTYWLLLPVLWAIWKTLDFS